MNRLLVILDFQRDFVYGPVATKDSEWKCSQAAWDLCFTSKDYYKAIAFGLVTHPIDHMSFRDSPKHCIVHSMGAAIEECIHNASMAYTKNIKYFSRGTYSYQDEKSFMSSADCRSKFLRLLNENNIEQIDVIGISSSVQEFILDLCDFGKDRLVNVRLKFCASDDNNAELIKLINSRNIKYDEKC